jgi:putative transposase
MPNPLDMARYRIVRLKSPGCRLSAPHRILHINTSVNETYLFRMLDPLIKPVVVSWSYLRGEWQVGSLIVEEFKPPDIMLLPEEDIPYSYRAHRDKKWALFEPILNTECCELLFENLGAIVSEFSDEKRLPKKTVYRAIFRFYYYGCTPNAFLPRFDLRGGEAGFRTTGVTKRGRPPDTVILGHDESAIGVNVTAEDLANIRWALQQFWVLGAQYTFKKTYTEMCKLRYADKTENGLKLPKDRPNCRQFIYHAKNLPEFPALLRKRIGEKKFDRDFRTIIGRSSAEVLGPADRYQIDATIADIYLTSMYSRNWIIGRPIIYAVVDVFSGYVVGVFVGLEGPSWEGARLALLNAFSDKKEFLLRYGFDESDEWDAHHIPVSVFADRAELLGNNARGLVSGLGIAIDIASSYRPDWKGLVERKFRILNDMVIHFMPGAVLKRNRERGERNYALDGTLNLFEFTKIIIREILYFNEHHEVGDRATPAMIAAGVRPTHAGLWRFGMEHLVGGTPHRTKEEIYAHLLPRGVASVQENGICFEGLRYTSRFALEHRWFEKARSYGRFSVDVRYHNETPERIWVVDKPAKGIRVDIHEATLLDPFGRYGGVHWEEARDLLKFEKLQHSDNLEQDMESLINKDASNDQDIARAKSERQAQRMDISDRRRIMGIRQHKQNEKAAERRQRASEEMNAYGQASAKEAEANPLTGSRDRSMTPMDAVIWNALQSDEE